MKKIIYNLRLYFLKFENHYFSLLQKRCEVMQKHCLEMQLVGLLTRVVHARVYPCKFRIYVPQYARIIFLIVCLKLLRAKKQ